MSVLNKELAAAESAHDEVVEKKVTEADIREQIQVLKSAYNLDTVLAPFRRYGVTQLKELSRKQLSELYKIHDRMINEIAHEPSVMAQNATLLAGFSGGQPWIHHRNSIEAEQELSDATDDDTALEDAVVHELAERCLRGSYSPADFKGEVMTIEGVSFTVDDGMVDYVQHYLDYIRKVTDDLLAESRAASAAWESEDFGTTDFVVVDEDLFRTLVDLRHGLNIVSTDESSRLMLYALGLYQEISLMCGGPFRLVVIQSRREGFTEHSLM